MREAVAAWLANRRRQRHRAGAPSAALTSLSVSAGSLNPAFDPEVFSYAVAVDNDVDEITVYGSAAPYAVSSLPETAPLDVGANEIKVYVVARSSSIVTADYTITVTRAGP